MCMYTWTVRGVWIGLAQNNESVFDMLLKTDLYHCGWAGGAFE